MRTTPGLFRTRIIAEGVTPALYVQYKNTRIKQYHKEGQALRTETTINNTRDFQIGKRIHNLPALREIGFQANRRLLQTERIQRIPKTHRYQVTDLGFRAGLFFSKIYSRILRPGLAFVLPEIVATDSKLRRAFRNANLEIENWIQHAKLAAA